MHTVWFEALIWVNGDAWTIVNWSELLYRYWFWSPWLKIEDRLSLSRAIRQSEARLDHLCLINNLPHFAWWSIISEREHRICHEGIRDFVNDPIRYNHERACGRQICGEHILRAGVIRAVYHSLSESWMQRELIRRRRLPRGERDYIDTDVVL